MLVVYVNIRTLMSLLPKSARAAEYEVYTVGGKLPFVNLIIIARPLQHPCDH